jgi:hypothetical protein
MHRISSRTKSPLSSRDVTRVLSHIKEGCFFYSIPLWPSLSLKRGKIKPVDTCEGQNPKTQAHEKTRISLRARGMFSLSKNLTTSTTGFSHNSSVFQLKGQQDANSL